MKWLNPWLLREAGDLELLELLLFNYELSNYELSNYELSNYELSNYELSNYELSAIAAVLPPNGFSNQSFFTQS